MGTGIGNYFTPSMALGGNGYFRVGGVGVLGDQVCTIVV